MQTLKLKVKIFDYNYEGDLQNSINNFIKDKEVVDIKFNVAVSITDGTQVYCYSAMIIYKDNL